MPDRRSVYPDGPVCPWPPVPRNDETGFFRGEKPRAFSATRLAYPPGPGRPKGTRRADLAGRHFRHLTVVERVKDYVTPSGKAHPQYLCRCVCGNLTQALGHNLTSGRTTSCGHVGFGKPYDVIGPLQGRPVATRTDEEIQAHRARAAWHRKRLEAEEAEARKRRKAETRKARNARRREAYRQAAIARWAG